MEQNPSNPRKKLLLVPLILLAVLLLIWFTADINIYGVWCHANHFELTPKAAVLAMGDPSVSQSGLSAETPDYVWRVDESNAVACFVLPDGILTERLYTKRSGYFSTGCFNFFAFDGASPAQEGEEQAFVELRRIKSNGFYGDSFSFTLVRGDAIPTDCEAALRIPAGEETWTLVTPK